MIANLSDVKEHVDGKGRVPVLSGTDIVKSYGSDPVLKGVSVSVDEGEIKVMMGGSGSGKSTLLRVLCLLEPYESGAIHLDGSLVGVASSKGGGPGRRLGERAMARQRAAMGMVFQSFNLFPHLSAQDNVELALKHVRRRSKAEAAEKATRMLERVGLAERRNAFPPELSGGQQQRVAIARALALEPRVMLFDEPTSALDPELVGEVLKVMEGLAADGMTMLVVTHEHAFARRIADTVLLMDRGKVVEESPPEVFFSSNAHARTQEFLSHVL